MLLIQPQSSSASTAAASSPLERLLIPEESAASRASLVSSSSLPTELCLDPSNHNNRSSNSANNDKCWLWPDLLTALHYGRGRALRSVELSLNFGSSVSSSAAVRNEENTAEGNNVRVEEEDDPAGTERSTRSAASPAPQQSSNINSSSSSSFWIHLFLQTLGRCCPELTSLRLYAGHYHHHHDNDNSNTNRSTNDGTIPASLLGSVVRACPQLQSLVVIHALQLNTSTSTTHDDDDVQELAQALHQHAALQEIKLVQVRVAGRGNFSVCLDPILEALSTIETLETVDLSLHNATSNARKATTTTPTASISTTMPGQQQQQPHAAFSPHSLALVLHGCHRLTDMTLWNCGLSDAHIVALIPPLQRHATLQFLSLRHNPNISDATWCRFYHDALRYCYSLHALFNDHADFSQHMPHHPALLSHQHPQHPADSSSGTADHHDHNNATAAMAAELFLGLNGLGRGYLVRPPPPSNRPASCGDDARRDWVELLDSVGDSPAALYYVIRDGVSQWLSFVN